MGLGIQLILFILKPLKVKEMYTIQLKKPIALGQYLIKTYTEEGAVILDNAFGSGSFLIAAIKEKEILLELKKY